MEKEKNLSRIEWLLVNRIPLLVQKIKDRENLILDPQTSLECLIKADPSQNNSAVQWLIESYTRDGFLWEDLQGGKTSKVSETLILFNRYQPKLSSNQRSLYNYSHLSDLYQAIEPFVQTNGLEDTVDQNPTENEIKRDKKIQAYKQTHRLFENNRLQVIIPLSKQAAEWWGQGTRWCTAAKEHNQFYTYNQKAPLIILLFKDQNNKNRRLQLWIDIDNEQFMDEKDSDVEKELVIDNWNTLEPVMMWAIQKSGAFIKYFPPEFINQSLCESAVESNPFALKYMPTQYQTKQICRQAVIQDYRVLEWVKRPFRTQKILSLAIENDSRALELIKEKDRTLKLCLKAVSKSGLMLKWVPDPLKTDEICSKAIEQSAEAFKYTPIKFRTYERSLTCFKKALSVLSFIPKHFLNKEMFECMAKPSWTYLHCVPENLKTYDLCETFVKVSGLNLKFVPDNLKTKELCILAVTNNANALQAVPESLKTYDLCAQAVSDKTLHFLNYIPEKIIDYNLIKLIVKNGLSLAEVLKNRQSSKFIDHEICLIAVKKNGHELNYVPDPFRTDKIIQAAIDQNGWAFACLKDHERSDKLYAQALSVCVKNIADDEHSLSFLPDYVQDDSSNIVKDVENHLQNTLFKEQKWLIEEIQSEFDKIIIYTNEKKSSTDLNSANISINLDQKTNGL